MTLRGPRYAASRWLALAALAIGVVAAAQSPTPAPPAPRPVPPGALSMWSGALDAHPALAREPFFFLMMTSGIAAGGAAEIDTAYRDYLSRTSKVGVAVPILYLRTTKGSAGDWAFD